MPAQLGGEISEIGVPSDENHNIGPHLDRKLERIDRHHHVHVRLVMTFFGGRAIFGHHHESIGTQPVHEFVFPVPLLLPRRNGGRQSGMRVVGAGSGVVLHIQQSEVLACLLGEARKIAQPQMIYSCVGKRFEFGYIPISDEFPIACNRE